MVVAHKSSSEEIGILRKIFRKYDSRHDGSIWFEEFCEAMCGSSLSDEELRVIFDAMVSTCLLYQWWLVIQLMTNWLIVSHLTLYRT